MNDTEQKQIADRIARVLIKSVTVDSEATAISTAFQNDFRQVNAVILDSGLVGTTLTFQGSVDGTTFKELRSSTGLFKLTVAASQHVSIEKPELFTSVRALKVRVGTSTGATQQTSARTLKFVMRKREA